MAGKVFGAKLTLTEAPSLPCTWNLVHAWRGLPEGAPQSKKAQQPPSGLRARVVRQTAQSTDPQRLHLWGCRHSNGATDSSLGCSHQKQQQKETPGTGFPLRVPSVSDLIVLKRPGIQPGEGWWCLSQVGLGVPPKSERPSRWEELPFPSWEPPGILQGSRATSSPEGHLLLFLLGEDPAPGTDQVVESQLGARGPHTEVGKKLGGSHGSARLCKSCVHVCAGIHRHTRRPSQCHVFG